MFTLCYHDFSGTCRLLTGLQMLLLLLISPVSIILICQTLYNVVTGNAQIHSLEFFSLLTDLQHSVLYAIIDHLVYKNYLLNIVCLVLYPTWLMFWSLLFMNVQNIKGANTLVKYKMSCVTIAKIMLPLWQIILENINISSFTSIQQKFTKIKTCTHCCVSW